jgi:hypothetical protein
VTADFQREVRVPVPTLKSAGILQDHTQAHVHLQSREHSSLLGHFPSLTKGVKSHTPAPPSYASIHLSLLLLYLLSHTHLSLVTS